MRSQLPAPRGDGSDEHIRENNRWLAGFTHTERPPTVVINPANDSDFDAHVKSLLPTAGSTPESLVEALRPRYPQAVIHRRELSSEPITIWYVYRDGRWVG